MKTNDYSTRVFKYDNSWVCEYPDLPECTGIGNTADEVVADGDLAKEFWLKVYFEDHGEYPTAIDVYSKDFSGYFSVRTSKQLHRELAVLAFEQVVSLNAFCGLILSEVIGKKQVTSTLHINVPVPKADLQKKQSTKSPVFCYLEYAVLPQRPSRTGKLIRTNAQCVSERRS
jgi:antitoxin HicB